MIFFSFFLLWTIGDSIFCMGEDDKRLRPMCCHFLSDSPCNDMFLGSKECQSPFTTYTIEMPKNKKAKCGEDSDKHVNRNCGGFDVRNKTFFFFFLRSIFKIWGDEGASPVI